MVFILEFWLSGVSSIPEIEGTFMEATKQGLSESSFVGVLVWPNASGECVNLIVAGDADPVSLANCIVAKCSQGTSDFSVSSMHSSNIGELPAEIDSLPSDERLLEIARMAVPAPGETCGRCDTVLPPHQGWCPWGLGGPENPPSHRERSLGGDSEDAPREKLSIYGTIKPQQTEIPAAEPEKVTSAKSP
jgi:hypothetical protein